MQSPKTAAGDCSLEQAEGPRGRAPPHFPNAWARSPWSHHPLKLHNEWNAGKGKRSRAGHRTKPPPKSLTKAKHIYSAVAKKDTGGGEKGKDENGQGEAVGRAGRPFCSLRGKNPKICVGLCSVF